MLLTRISRLTGRQHCRDVPITEEQLANWQLGALIQNAAPNLSAEDREFVISGITPEEWKEAFGT
jgi:hypothetical protein